MVQFVNISEPDNLWFYQFVESVIQLFLFCLCDNQQDDYSFNRQEFGQGEPMIKLTIICPKKLKLK